MTATAPTARELAERIRSLLAQANPATVPSGILAWWGRTDLPDGAARAPALGQTAWQGIYFLIENAALARGTVKPLPSVMATVNAVRPDEPLPVAIANFRVAMPRTPFGDGGELPPPALADAVEERRVFAASALMHPQWGLAEPVYRGRDVRFVVGDDLLLSNAGDPPPDAIEADLGDGRGFQRVVAGEPFGARYASGDTATVALRCHYGDTALNASFSVRIGDYPAPPRPDETWALRGDVAGDTPGNTGNGWVFRAPGHRDVVNPVIVVEGFPGMHPCDYMYELLNQQGTVDALHAAGYDLIIVGLDNGMDLIQRNAGVVVDCIRKARARTRQPLVVGGVSMGGIVSRYALTLMEHSGEPHGARVYLSIDAPHGGTYTSLGVQWFVHSLLPFCPALGGFAHLIDSPSNQQLLIAWLHDGTVAQSPLRDQLLRDLDAIGGYPREPRKLAVACGRGDGAAGANAGVRTLSWDGEPFISVALNTLPGDRDGVLASGSWLLGEPPELRPLPGGGIPWEAAPGSQNNYNAQVYGIAAGIGAGTVAHDADRTCCIPTVSAIDLRQDPFTSVRQSGPFDDHVCSADNVQHLQITPEVSRWIVEQLGTPPAPAPAWDPVKFNPHDPAFLNDPYETYARFRDEAPISLVQPYNSYWCFRYADCQRILTETETFLKRPVGPAPPPPPGPPGAMSIYPIGVFGSDPPRHEQLRSQLEPPLRAAIQGAPELAARFATPIVTAAAARGHMELVADYALPVPAQVLFTVLGIPTDPGVWEGLLAWQAAIVRAHDITQTAAVKATAATCGMALHAYLVALVKRYQQTPGPGVLGQLCQSIGPDLTADDVHMCAYDFVIAGYLSTTYLIASGVRALLEHPDQLAALRAKPDDMGRAIEEMLRFEPPLQVIDRFPAHDVELAGQTVKAGERVTAVVASADRDPAAFEDPDVFRIDRPDAGQMSFGAGIHYCIGAPLVRLAAPAAMAALLTLQRIEIAGLPQWQTDPYLRGMVNLPLTLG
jgi:cytochrome P450